MTERRVWRAEQTSVDDLRPDPALRRTAPPIATTVEVPKLLSPWQSPDRRSLPEGVEFPSRHNWPVELRSGNVVLRGLRRPDRKRWDEVRTRNRAWTGPWDATMPPEGGGKRPSFGQMVRLSDRAGREGTALPFAVCWDEGWPGNPTEPKRCRLSGQVSVSNIVLGSARFGSIGYWVDEELAGRGVAPTAVALATDYCFQVMRLHRIEVCIRPENTKSLRVVDKLGFRPEGLRRAFLHIDGEWRDHLCFALTKDEVPGGVLNRYLG